MAHGGILWSDLDTTRGRIPRQDCQRALRLWHFVALTFGGSSYQKLYFRNLNHPIGRASVVSRRQESRTAVASMNRSLTDQTRDDRRLHPVGFYRSFFIMLNEFCNNRSHIFDGVTLTSETAAFQLCDITDPMLKQMIDEEEDVRDSCDVGTFCLILSLGFNCFPGTGRMVYQPCPRTNQD